MCECGCVSNDKKFVFPAPNRAIYILTLSGGCVSCDAPSAVVIELVEPTDTLYREYQAGEFLDGNLKFEQWPDSQGVAIKTGMIRSEFIKAMSRHLVGIGTDSGLFGDDGRLDAVGSDELLKEAYEDSQTRPTLI